MAMENRIIIFVECQFDMYNLLFFYKGGYIPFEKREGIVGAKTGSRSVEFKSFTWSNR